MASVASAIPPADPFPRLARQVAAADTQSHAPQLTQWHWGGRVGRAEQGYREIGRERNCTARRLP